MNKLIKVAKCIVFFIIGVFILQTLTYIMVPKNLEQVTMNKFYDEPSGTIDVLALGSSTIRSAYSPITIWDEYGITSYALGTSNQTMGLSYYMLLEALKYQNPKVIIMDFESAFVEDLEMAYRKTLDNMKLDNIKIQALNDEKLYNVKEERLSYIFPILRFHSRWNLLEQDDVNKLSKFIYYERTFKGNVISVHVAPYVDTNNYMADKNIQEEISEENLYYIEKIVRLCENNNIKILWTALPSSTSWSFARHEETQRLSDMYGIRFIDYNIEEMSKKINLDWSQDTNDKGDHLNSFGAEKVSSDIGSVLSKEFGLENRKNDNKVAKQWEKSSNKYKKTKQEIK